MLARLAAAATGLALLAGGCGGGGDRRDAIAAYIDEVNAVYVELAGPLAQVTRANRRFASPDSSPAKARPALVRAEATLRGLRERLGALDPPPDAERLHGRLVRLVDAEVHVAREVIQLATFLPRFSQALRPLEPANRRVQTALRSEADEAAKAAALDRYRADLDRVVARLRELHPPPVSAPAHGVQVRTLERVSERAGALAEALRAKRAEDVARLVREMAAAALSGVSLASQRAQIAAVKAYNDRIARIGRLARGVERERQELQLLVD